MSSLAAALQRPILFVCVLSVNSGISYSGIFYALLLPASCFFSVSSLFSQLLPPTLKMASTKRQTTYRPQGGQRTLVDIAAFNPENNTALGQQQTREKISVCVKNQSAGFSFIIALEILLTLGGYRKLDKLRYYPYLQWLKVEQVLTSPPKMRFMTRR